MRIYFCFPAKHIQHLLCSHWGHKCEVNCVLFTLLYPRDFTTLLHNDSVVSHDPFSVTSLEGTDGLWEKGVRERHWAHRIPLTRVQWDKENCKEIFLLIDTAHIWGSDNFVSVEVCPVHHIILSQMHFLSEALVAFLFLAKGVLMESASKHFQMFPGGGDWPNWESMA